MWAGGDCRATRSLRLGSASALRLIWRGAAVSMESTLGCLDAGCSKQRSFCCLLPALALGPSFACRFSWPFIYIHLSGRLLALPRSLPRFLPSLASPRSTLRVKGRSSPHCLATMRSSAKLHVYGKKGGGGAGKTRMLPANFTFSQISRGSFWASICVWVVLRGSSSSSGDIDTLYEMWGISMSWQSL